MTTTCECGRPTSGGAWCTAGNRSCRHTVEVAIANVAAYFDDLDTVRTRQTSYGGLAAVGSIGRSQPLVVDAAFLPGGRGHLAQTATRQAVTSWARQLRLSAPQVGGPRYDTVHSVCAYFASQLTVIAGMPWADAFKADMLACERALAKVVDRPAEGWYAGECGFIVGLDHDGTTCACACHNSYAVGDVEVVVSCDVPGGCGREYDGTACTQVLYAEPGNPYVRCRVCASTYPVAERRDALLEQARDREATVEIITRIVTTLGDRDVRAAKVNARIRQWAVRGRITSHGLRVVDGRPRPVYRVGDVLDLLADDERITR